MRNPQFPCFPEPIRGRIPPTNQGPEKARKPSGEMTDNDLCDEVITGWSGVQDAKGGEVPFSEKAKADLLNVPLVASSVVTAWLDSLAKAKRKN